MSQPPEPNDYVQPLQQKGAAGQNSAMHVKVASPLLLTMIILVAITVLLAVVCGVIAIVHNSFSETKINILGMMVSTGHVGVAFVGLGIIAIIVIYKNIVSNIYKLAALPEDKRKQRNGINRRNRVRR